MTVQQIIVGAVVYSLALALVSYITRPNARRLAGALAGAVVATGLALWVLIPFGEPKGLRRVPLDPSASYMTLLFLGAVVSTVPVFPMTWRITRRFGCQGLAVTLAIAAVIRPPRELAVAARFPEWVTYTPGIATILTLGAAYAGGFAAGHGVMRLVSGPAKADPLARWPRYFPRSRSCGQQLGDFG